MVKLSGNLKREFESYGTIHRFKVKGLEHAKGAGKVKTLKPVDEEKENRKRAFVNDVACVSWRLEQFYNETMTEVDSMDMTHFKIFKDKLFADIVKEEMDTMVENGFEFKELSNLIPKVAVTYFRSRLDEEAGL